VSAESARREGNEGGVEVEDGLQESQSAVVGAEGDNAKGKETKAVGDDMPPNVRTEPRQGKAENLRVQVGQVCAGLKSCYWSACFLLLIGIVDATGR
jgi:hypothetical protein